MRKNIKTILISLFILNSFCHAQTARVGSINELKKIYESLEFDTEGKDNLKQKWIINDYLFVKEIYSRFKSRSAFRINSAIVNNQDLIKRRFLEIDDGKVIIDVRRRYYDDEIEYFAFISATTLRPLYDPIIDGFLLREIIGEKLYAKIKKKEYGYIDMNVKKYYTVDGFFYDINLNVLSPELLFWSTTSDNRNLPEIDYEEDIVPSDLPDTISYSDTDINDTSSTVSTTITHDTTQTSVIQTPKKTTIQEDVYHVGKNKYLLSFFGKWGNEYIDVPGWYFPVYVAGLKLAYYNEIDPQRTVNNYSYCIQLGLGFPSGKPFPNQPQPLYPLYNSGHSIYLNLSGDILRIFFKKFRDSEFFGEGYFTIDNNVKSDYGVITNLVDFFTIRNYMILGFRKRNIVDLSDFGQFEAMVGFSSHDANFFELSPNVDNVIDLRPYQSTLDRYENSIIGEIGIESFGGLIQHTLAFFDTHNFHRGLGYVGFKGKIMIDETFGIETIVQTSYQTNKNYGFPGWRKDTYFVISPVFRINY